MRDVRSGHVSSDVLWMLLATFGFGLANAISHGRWQPVAIVLLALLLAALVWNFVRADRSESPRPLPTSPLVLAGVLGLVALEPITALFDPKIISQYQSAAGVIRATEGIAVALALSYLPFLSGQREEGRGLRNVRFAAFAILAFALGSNAISANPAPGIDVWTIQMKGAGVLLDGHNPYVFASVPDTDPENDFTVPYCYPPAAIYSGVLGVLFGKDVRWATLGAVLVAGFAMRFIAGHARGREPSGVRLPAILEDAPAILFWQTPLLAMILELSWIDPLQVMLISIGVAAFVAGKRTLAAVVLGVAISSKQSMFWLAPLAAFVLFGGFADWKRWAAMAVGALVPIAPFLLWDFKALKYANFDFMSGLPPRRDALCFTNALFKWFHVAFPPASAFLLAAGVVGWACLRVRRGTGRSPLSFARAVVLTYFLFFFFNRWAFANYYFLLTGLSALAASTGLAGPESERELAT